MISFKPHDEPLFTLVSLYSLLGVVALLAFAHFSGLALLPARTRKVDQGIFVWLVSGLVLDELRLSADPLCSYVLQVFDALIHLYVFRGIRSGTPAYGTSEEADTYDGCSSIFEGAFLYNSMFGKTVFKGVGWSAELCEFVFSSPPKSHDLTSGLIRLSFATTGKEYAKVGSPCTAYLRAYLMMRIYRRTSVGGMQTRQSSPSRY